MQNVKKFKFHTYYVYILFILTIGLFILLYTVNKNTEQRNFAQVPLPYPIPTWSPSASGEWATNYVSLKSDELYIRIGDKKYSPYKPNMIHSNVGLDSQTLEITWVENTVEMHMNLYFRKKTDNEWELYDIRTSNGAVNWDWIYYKPLSAIESTIGYHYYTHTLTLTGYKPSGVDAEIVCKNCTIQPFTPQTLKYYSSGYAIEVLSGLAVGEVLSLTPNVNNTITYGVDVVLRNSAGEVITKPVDTFLEFVSQNPEIVNVSYSPSIPEPHYGAQLSGVKHGETAIDIRLIQSSTNKVLAMTSFPVVVNESGVYGTLNAKSPECTIGIFADNADNKPQNYIIEDKITQVVPGQQFVIATNFVNNTRKQYERVSNHISLGRYLTYVDSNGSDCKIDEGSQTIQCTHGLFFDTGATSMAFRVKYIGSESAPLSVFGTTFASNGDTGSCSVSLNAIPLQN